LAAIYADLAKRWRLENLSTVLTGFRRPSALVQSHRSFLCADQFAKLGGKLERAVEFRRLSMAIAIIRCGRL